MYVINDKRIGIDIQIEEGNKFYIRNVSWVGNSQYSTELLQAMLGIEKGDTYDKRRSTNGLASAVKPTSRTCRRFRRFIRTTDT